MEQQLAACLEATLSPDSDVRTRAEAQLESFRSPERDPRGQAGLGFVDLLLTPTAPVHLRQAAGIALRKYITARWSPYFDGFVGPAIQVSVKQQIRQALLGGLADPVRKIRLATSYAISTIAGPDYPDEYADLLPRIGQLLQQGEPNGLHGAMALLSEFVRVEMDEVQLIHVAKEILPVLEQVLADQERHTAYIRARCLLVFRQCLTTLFMVKETYPDAVKQASQTMLPRWLAMMQQLLAKDPAQQLGTDLQGWGTLALRNEIFKTLKVAAMFRAPFKSHLHAFMHSSISNLSSLLPVFRQLHLSNASDLSAPTPEEGDDDVACDVPALACSILDFINEASRGDRCRDVFLRGGTGGQGQETEVLQQLISLLLVYIDMTVDDEDNWASDANAFIADEDDETLAYSLRIAAADLLGMLIEDFPVPALRSIGLQVHQLIQQADAARQNGDQDWWKVHEGVLTAVGNNADAITDIIETQSETKQALNLETIFTAIVLPNVGTDAPPFLQGRGFVFASQFATSLPSELAVQFLDAAVNAIEYDRASLPVKISAVRTIKNFYRHLPSSVVGPYAARIVQKLGPLLTQASEDTLILIIETIQAVVVEELDSGKATTSTRVEPAIIGEIVKAALQVWASNARDIILLSVVSDLLESLAGSKQPGVSQVTVQQSLPYLAAAIGSSLAAQADPSTADSEPSAVAETAVELAKSVLDGAEPGSLRGAVSVLCPNLFSVLSASQDRDVLQNGIECLTVLVKKCTQELVDWKDPRTQTSSIDLMLQIIAALLVPSSGSESGGLAVGDLVVALLRKAGDRIVHVLPELLNAMVRRLATAQTATFIQSLIVPIAFLMHNNDEQAKQIMDLLESIQIAPSAEDLAGESGNGLEIMCKKWVDNVETFQGFWSQRISALGLAKVLDSRRSFLTNMYVRGDILPDTSGIIRTRSRAKTMPHQYSSVPMFAKIVKVLLKEWSSASQTAGAGAARNREDGARTPDTDDEDGEWDDEYEPRAAGQDDLAFLSDMLGPGGLDALQNEDDFSLDDDEDLKSDPVYQMDLKVSILVLQPSELCLIACY